MEVWCPHAFFAGIPGLWFGVTFNENLARWMDVPRRTNPAVGKPQVELPSPLGFDRRVYYAGVVPKWAQETLKYSQNHLATPTLVFASTREYWRTSFFFKPPAAASPLIPARIPCPWGCGRPSHQAWWLGSHAKFNCPQFTCLLNERAVWANIEHFAVFDNVPHCSFDHECAICPPQPTTACLSSKQLRGRHKNARRRTSNIGQGWDFPSPIFWNKHCRGCHVVTLCVQVCPQ